MSKKSSLKHGMLKTNKWKYLKHFQNNEFNDLISKEIMEKLYKGYRTEEVNKLEKL